MIGSERVKYLFVFLMSLIILNITYAQNEQNHFDGIWKNDNASYTFSGNTFFNQNFDPLPGGQFYFWTRGTYSFNNSTITMNSREVSLDQGKSWMPDGRENRIRTVLYKISGIKLTFIGEDGKEYSYIKQQSTQTNHSQSGNIWKTEEQFVLDGRSYQGLTITGYNGTPPKNLIIPNEINGRHVVAIGVRAFQNIQLDSVIISEGIKYIGEYSFWQTGIQNLKLPETVEVIDGAAFGMNKLTELLIPKSVEIIELYAFQFNQIKKLTINGETDIGIYAFGSNPLTEIIIASVIDTNVVFGVATTFPNNFEQFYINNGKQKGKYVFRNGNWQYSR